MGLVVALFGSGDVSVDEVDSCALLHPSALLGPLVGLRTAKDLACWPALVFLDQWPPYVWRSSCFLWQEIHPWLVSGASLFCS